MNETAVFENAKLTDCYAFVQDGATALKSQLSKLKPGFKGIVVDSFVFEGLNYKILTDDNEPTVEVADNKDFVGELKIPEKVKFAGVEYFVVGIGNGAFDFNKKITSIVLHDNIKTVGGIAFRSVSSTNPLVLPSSLERVLASAFDSSYITWANLDFPVGMEKVGAYAFNNCKVNTKKASIPASVSSLDYGMFSGIERIDVDSKNANYKSIDGVLFSKDGEILIEYPQEKKDMSYEIPQKVKTIGYIAFYICKNLQKIIVPDSVESIKGYAFTNCTSLAQLIVNATTPPKLDADALGGLNSGCIVLVPKGCASKYKAADGWKQIANQIIDKIPTTFQRDNINYKVVSMENKTVEVAVNSDASGAITIPSQVTHCGDNYTVIGIGTNAFAGNSKITDITWPDTIKYFGAFALYHVSLKKTITLPSSLESIENQAFWSNKLTFSSLNLPSGLKTIKRWAFAAVKALNKEVKIPASVCSIEYGTFQESNIERIKVDGGNVNYKSMDDGVLFSKNGDTLIEYPCANSRQTYTVPTKVTTIGNEAFCFCMNLKAIILPSTIKKIGPRVFSSSTSLELLDIKATTPPTLDAISFEEFSSKCFVRVPKGCAAKYKTAEVWKTIASRIVEDDTQIQFSIDNINYRVLSLDDRKVEVDESPKATGVVVIPNQVPFCGFSFNVVTIGSNAFGKNNAVTSLTIPSCTERILYGAFSWMRKMTGELKIPASVKEIDRYAFCYSTYRLKVDSGNQYYCTDDNVLFNKNKTELIYYLACKPMCNEYKVPDTVTKIDGPTFQDAMVKHLRLPASLKAFAGTPFYNSRYIEKITIAATTPPTANSDIFGYFSYTGKILDVIVPKNCATKYKTAPGWKDIAGKIREL